MHLRQKKIVAFLFRFRWPIQFNWSDIRAVWYGWFIHPLARKRQINSNQTYCKFQIIMCGLLPCNMNAVYVLPSLCEMSNEYTYKIHLHSSPNASLYLVLTRSIHSALFTSIFLSFYRTHWYTWLIHSYVFFAICQKNTQHGTNFTLNRSQCKRITFNQTQLFSLIPRTMY